MPLDGPGPAGRLLVADDEPDVIDLVRIFFEQQGWHVDGAADGRSALEMARRVPYDAILLDVAMPGMDGMTLCRELRQAGIDVPILMLTARDTDADKLRGFGAGAEVFTREQLFEAVWGERYLDGDSNTVTVHIRRLRSRLGDDPSRGAMIRTVWGVGYRFEPPREAGSS